VIVINNQSAAQTNDAPSLLEALGTQPTPACAQVLEIERGKFRNCRLRWLTQEIDIYAAAVESLRAERTERERNQVWDWLAIQPIQDCTTVPEIEIAKFPLCSGDASGGNNMLASHENGLAQLRASRDQLASDLQNLRERMARIRDRTKDVPLGPNEPAPEALEPLLVRLQDLDAQVRLLEMMSAAQIASAHAQKVVSLHMTSATTGAQLLDAASATATVLAAIQVGDRFVRIETNDTQSDFIPIVHATSGFGYVARAELGQ